VAVAAEYAHHVSPFLAAQGVMSTPAVCAGQGLTVQASWLLPRSSWEPVLRVTTLTPELAMRALGSVESISKQAFGLTRYVQGHRIKVSTDVLHGRFAHRLPARRRTEWTPRMGEEVGI